MNKKTNFLTIALIIGMSCGIAACETVKGAGKDIQNAGETVQRAVD